ncbi:MULTISPECIES: DL-endopeptidase inhibitor IseA family protein [Paenibacillus]|uniref:DL-endopeptidase inhibitor IseA family protein n=1 Tax=Paenibacillus TaxID=44249 RepID=UPI00096D9620|nr:DL-endopeptidase inhibitor IseA family protein [Paenibacillus odorifer]OMC92873.1 hypothetical protein BJP46_09180 [Paenibacillus odorifer]OMD08461.1 hypothetical protein BJP50_07690 [Paenibacillus odorifer]
MNKKWMLGSLALSLGLLSAGSGVMAASSSVGSSAIKNVAVIGTGKEGPATINNLTVKSVVPLVVHARAIYFYTSRGGNFFPMETFMYKAQEYRYLSNDIGTKAKLMNYIKKAYTHNAAAYYVQTQFLEHEGRMSQVNADFGNSLMFEKATARMLSKTATTAEFDLTVPYSSGQEGSESVYVKLKKVNGYWRIDTSPDILF